MEQSNKLLVTDENGLEKEMEIMFTFDYNEKSYVVYFDPNDTNQEVAVYASVYDSSGNLYPVESEEEWDVIDQMVESFTSDDEEEKDDVQ